jgi:transcriptional regulator GlxA family with amidase domain
MISVHIIVYEDVDEIELCSPFEVLTSCRRLANGRWGTKPVFNVDIVGEHNATVRCAHGMNVLPDKALTRAFDADVVIVPGGPGARREHPSKQMMEYLSKAFDSATIVGAISTGVFLLGKAGTIDNRRVTTHPSCTEELARTYPKAYVVQDHHIVADGTPDNLLLTTSAITSGIELALMIIDKYEGHETAALAARRIGWSHTK